MITKCLLYNIFSLSLLFIPLELYAVRSVILKAVEDGEWHQVRALLDKHQENINAVDHKGRSLLQRAAAKGHAGLVTEMRKEQADPLQMDPQGRVVLSYAALEGHVGVAQALEFLGCNYADYTGLTPLHMAASRGHRDMVQALCENKAWLNTQSFAREDDPEEGGKTALLYACAKGHAPVVEVLVGFGADVNLPDRRGITPLLIACWLGHESVVSLLLNQGKADPNKPRGQGITPLMVASYQGHDGIARQLVNAGAKLNLRDEVQGARAVEFSLSQGHNELARFLKEVAEEEEAHEARIKAKVFQELFEQKQRERLATEQELLRFKEHVQALHHNLLEEQTRQMHMHHEEHARQVRKHAQKELATAEQEFLYFKSQVELVHHQEAERLRRVHEEQHEAAKQRLQQELATTEQERERLKQEIHGLHHQQAEQLKQDQEARAQLVKSLETQLQEIQEQESQKVQQLAGLIEEDKKRRRKQEIKEERARKLQYLQGLPEPKIFYNTVSWNLESIFMALKVLDTGMVMRQPTGVIPKVSKGLQLLGAVVSIPVVSGIFKGASAAVDIWYEYRETKKVRTINDVLSNYAALTKEIEKAAQALTYRYEKQIRVLTDESAKVLAECAVRRFLEYMRAGELQKESTLTDQLFLAVSYFDSNQGLFPFRQKELTLKIDKGRRWTDRGLFQYSGLKVSDGMRFTHPNPEKNKVEKYGWRLGNETEADAKQWKRWYPPGAAER